MADGLEDRVDETGHTRGIEGGERRLERIERGTELGHGHHAGTGPRRSSTTRRFEALTLSTVSAPASTAARISAGSKLSTLTRSPAPVSSRTTSASAGNGRPGVQPMSITSAPDSRNASAAARRSRARQLRRVVDLGQDFDVVAP